MYLNFTKPNIFLLYLRACKALPERVHNPSLFYDRFAGFLFSPLFKQRQNEQTTILPNLQG